MKSGGLLAALALALALLAGLVWWLGQSPSTDPGGAQAKSVADSTVAPAAPVEVEAPTSKIPGGGTSAPEQREARGARSYQAPQSSTGSLAVRAVWDSTGKPAVNVGVRVERLGGHLLLLADSARTDANGLALFDSVDAGLIFVRGDRSGELFGEIVANQRVELELRLDAGLTVSGRVSDADGRSVSQGVVWLLAANRWTELAECDASGRFSIAELPDGSKLAATARDRSPSTTVTVSGAVGHVVQIDFQVGGPAASILGQVLDPDERPVTRAAVALVYRDRREVSISTAEPRRSVTCDEEGRFTLHSVPLGAAELIVQTAHFAPEVRQLEVKLGERHELIVHVTPGAELTGVVTYQGKPAEGAQVMVGDPFSTPWGGAVSDKQGRYRITGLPSGSQSVISFLRLDGARRLEWLETDADEELARAEAELVLVAGRAVLWNPELTKRN